MAKGDQCGATSAVPPSAWRCAGDLGLFCPTAGPCGVLGELCWVLWFCACPTAGMPTLMGTGVLPLCWHLGVLSLEQAWGEQTASSQHVCLLLGSSHSRNNHPKPHSPFFSGSYLGRDHTGGCTRPTTTATPPPQPSSSSHSPARPAPVGSHTQGGGARGRSVHGTPGILVPKWGCWHGRDRYLRYYH